MVNLMGRTLAEGSLIKRALQQYYGIGGPLATKVMARLSFHDRLRVEDMTEAQLSQLGALISAPESYAREAVPFKAWLPPMLAGAVGKNDVISSSPSPSSSSTPELHPSPSARSSSMILKSSAILASDAVSNGNIPRDPLPIDKDPVLNIVLEEDARRIVRTNIRTLYNIRTLRGLRHERGLPVRGQRTRTDAKTAKRLNRLNRRGYHTRSEAHMTRPLQEEQIRSTTSWRESPVLTSLVLLHRSQNRPSLS